MGHIGVRLHQPMNDPVLCRRTRSRVEMYGDGSTGQHFRTNGVAPVSHDLRLVKRGGRGSGSSGGWLVQYGDATAVNTAVSLDDCTTNWDFIRIVQGLVRPTLTKRVMMGKINRDLVLYLRAALSATLVAKTSILPLGCSASSALA